MLRLVMTDFLLTGAKIKINEEIIALPYENTGKTVLWFLFFEGYCFTIQKAQRNCCKVQLIILKGENNGKRQDKA